MARKKPFKPAYENFPVSGFKGISFRFEDDVYECARLLLRLDDAKGNGTNTIHRHTVYGLAREFASLADIPEVHVLGEFERRELPLRASVEFDDKPVFSISPSPRSGDEAEGSAESNPRSRHSRTTMTGRASCPQLYGLLAPSM